VESIDWTMPEEEAAALKIPEIEEKFARLDKKHAKLREEFAARPPVHFE
jgi:hypothetical protein